jgi:hypothetical protein
MDEAFLLLDKYFGRGSLAHKIIIAHSVAVKDMALKIASKNPHLKIGLIISCK